MLGAPGLHLSRLEDECLGALEAFSLFAKDVAPYVQSLDARQWFRIEGELERVLEAACHRRIFSLSIPKSLGGSGYSMLSLAVGLEHLSQTCVGIASLVATHGLALAVVGATGRARLLRTLADRIVAGERARKPYLLATCATEPSAGSDLEDFDALGRAKLDSHADAVTGGYLLHGRKIYVSNGSIAGGLVVLMPTARERPRETLSGFFVDANSSGVNIVRTEHKLGQRASPAAELVFDGCFVPDELRLNDATIAGRTMDLVLGSSRATVGAFGAGVARAIVHITGQLARQLQTTKGEPLIEHPKAKSVLGRMWMNANAARLSYVAAGMVQARAGLVSMMESEPLRALDRIVPQRLTHGAWIEKLLSWERIDHEARRLLAGLADSGIATASAFGSCAKVQTSEQALANCYLANQLLGFEATREGTGIPKYYRDARLLSIYEGTNEICTLDVAHRLYR
ncbi:MAG TPA: acyl-CoA dehydrogenase family protein [Polyangiaceae bacterium]|nr:acyl-CoA dehydrogenase family protein [Polyangiaceae bacterium]